MGDVVIGIDNHNSYYDPIVDGEEIKKIYDIYPLSELNTNIYDGLVIAVSQNQFKRLGIGSNKKNMQKETCYL